LAEEEPCGAVTIEPSEPRDAMEGSITRGLLPTYRKVDKDADFQPTEAHLNSFLFIFPSARALENVSTFFRKC
jgi:hypothetical protein